MKRIRKPANGGPEPSNKRQKGRAGAAGAASKPRRCLSAEEGEIFENYINQWFDTVIEPIFIEALERQEAAERAWRARPKAEIIPFNRSKK